MVDDNVGYVPGTTIAVTTHVNGVVDWGCVPLTPPQGGGLMPAYRPNNGVFATQGATNILAPSSKYGSCSNVYCHSNVQGSNGVGAPFKYYTSAWGGTLNRGCGSCHADMSSDPAATGSHIKHAPDIWQHYSCGTCHTGYTASSTNPATHVLNKRIDVIFPATVNLSPTLVASYNGKTTGGKMPGSGYSSCANIYCHSNSGPNGSTRIPSSVAPVWGNDNGKLGCGSCHLDMSTDPTGTGSHFAHTSLANATGPQLGCYNCHNGYSRTSVNVATHANQQVDLNFTVANTYSKVSPSAAGSTWGTCSASLCHGQAANIPWGGTIYKTGGDDCSTCHSSSAAGAVSTGTPFYSTQYPVKQTSTANALKSALIRAMLPAVFL